MFALSFAAAWLILTPALILFLNGYSITLQDLSLEKTGSVAVFTLPKSAQVTIVETGQTEDSPALFNQLEPGQYTVRVALEGYSTWQDQVEIQAQATNEINPVLLFARATPTVITALPSAVPLPTAPVVVANLSPKIQFLLSELNLSPRTTVLLEPSITVLDHGSNTLYYIPDPNAPQVYPVAERVQGMQWNDTETQLLYQTDFELVLYNPDQHEHQVVTRQSEFIGEAIWHPRGSYVLYTSGSDIIAIETRLTDSPNQFTLYTGTKPTDLITDKKGTMLFFHDHHPVSGEIELFQLPMQ